LFRKDLSTRFDFNIEIAFKHISSSKIQGINFNNLNKFLQNKGAYLN